MDIYIDIETLRSPETQRLQILEDVKANFKAPATLTKTQAASDLGLTDANEIKFTSKDDMIARWEKELASVKSESVADELWKKTSFNPDVAPIACIVIGYFNGPCFKLDVFETCDMVNEAEMLEEFHSHIDSICKINKVEVRKVNFIGHNIAKFDLPFIWKRSVINNVSTCNSVKWIDARHGQHCFDTMIAWAGFGKTISADNLCKLLGIKGKTDGMDGSKVYDTWQKNPYKVIEYCCDDVRLVKEIHKRLTK
jgi:3'-5' exonuclease